MIRMRSTLAILLVIHSASLVSAVVGNISCKCDTNGKITINMSSIDGEFNSFAIDTQGDPTAFNSTGLDANSCSYPITEINTTNIAKLKNCEYGQPVYLYLMKEPGILGGKSYKQVKFTCQVPVTGEFFNAVFDISIDQTNPNDTIPVVQSPDDFTLNMHIFPSSAYIGQSLNLTIADNTSNYLYPMNCTAYEKANRDNMITLLRDGHLTNTELLEAFNSKSPGVTFATLYAFKIGNSNYIVVKCTVKVCPMKDCTAQMVKRSLDTETKSETIRSTAAEFEVMDERTDSKSGHGRLEMSTMTLFVTSVIILADNVFSFI